MSVAREASSASDGTVAPTWDCMSSARARLSLSLGCRHLRVLVRNTNPLRRQSWRLLDATMRPCAVAISSTRCTLPRQTLAASSCTERRCQCSKECRMSHPHMYLNGHLSTRMLLFGRVQTGSIRLNDSPCGVCRGARRFECAHSG